MNEFEIKELVEKLDSILLNIIYLKPEERTIKPNMNQLEDMKSILDNIFGTGTCTEIMFTNNTDNLFFGIKVNPVITSADAIIILTSEEKVKFSKYQLEIDSKLFEIDLTAREIVAIILHEISSVIDSYEIIDQLRLLIDKYLMNEDDVISIRDSANYCQLIIYAIKDSLYKLSSFIFKENLEELLTNPMIKAAELEDFLVSAQQKIISSSYNVTDGVSAPKVVILKWMFMVYKSIKQNSSIIKETLKDAKSFTASRIDKIEIDKVLQAVDKIQMSTLESTNINSYLESKNIYSVNEISIFKALKTNGLRGIEDSLYEYAVRMKNCETEEDAMYILRGINSRLGVLEDYIYNTPDLSDNERKHWESVAIKYRQIRDELSKKKIWNKSSYGLFMDYSKLDNLDK